MVSLRQPAHACVVQNVYGINVSLMLLVLNLD